MTTPLAPRKVGLVLCLVGVAVFLLAGWGLWRDVEWLAQPFYAYAWWSYILFLDGFCVLRRGHSLLTTRRRFVFSLCLWSTSFWFFFELLNLRFQNWYYVGVFRVTSLVDFVGGGVFAVVCFSTVFVGLFETYEALTATGLWRSRGERRSSRVLPRPVSYAVQAFGVAMALSAILFPYYLAPLIWGSFTFLVDPWNYRRGHRSLLRDIEARDWGLMARLFLAGLVCGLVWESCNFFAPQKWIYTVRGLEGLKLFEMPLLGFLGFPGLAYDSVGAFALLSSFFLGGATWEHPGDLAYSIERRPAAPRRVFWGAACLQPVFWLVVSLLMVDVDGFKQINDRYGHLAGDQYLVEITNAIREQLRRADLACRYGGDEFCILLPETELEGARAIA
ncbi:MAG: GGDEF domain-containing protein, partial [Planctomycetota bacterium]|nr:GGDEF domain-containing protein [Planctomycetota bacterium]